MAKSKLAKRNFLITSFKNGKKADEVITNGSSVQEEVERFISPDISDMEVDDKLVIIIDRIKLHAGSWE